jgi:hypothetical protein
MPPFGRSNVLSISLSALPTHSRRKPNSEFRSCAVESLEQLGVIRIMIFAWCLTGRHLLILNLELRPPQRAPGKHDGCKQLQAHQVEHN